MFSGRPASARKTGGARTSVLLSCPERQLPLQNYGKPTFVQPTAQGQLLGSIGKWRYGGKGVESGL